uniref:Uncharacterized protein n=1 Tax=Magallana gigas TaxID=29159 RepID=A0A8W8L798_MAGGI
MQSMLIIASIIVALTGYQNDFSVHQQPVQSTTTDNVDLIINLIREFTDANHVYDLRQHIECFPHPDPTVRDNTGGTLPTPSSQPIAQTLQGLEDVSPQQLNYMNSIFRHVREEDQRLAYDHFCRELGRAPTVKEFSKFLLTFEGQLYLENKELLRLLDSQNQALGQRNNQIDNLQREKKNLQRYLEGTYIHSIQQQNEQQSSTISALETKIQLQNQRQQYFILLAAVIFAMVCFLFFF